MTELNECDGNERILRRGGGETLPEIKKQLSVMIYDFYCYMVYSPWIQDKTVIQAGYFTV